MNIDNIYRPDIQEIFKDSTNIMMSICYDFAKSKGFHDKPRNFATEIALLHSELSEALEADRIGNPKSQKIPGFSCVEEELADVVIRIYDTAENKQLRLAEAIIAKLQYNHNRPHKHGKEY